MAKIRFLYTFLLLLAVQLAVAQSGLQQYECWFDDDYAQRSVGSGSVPETIAMDISHLSPGLHYFNFRAKTTSSQWGALSRYMIYLSDTFVTGCEYWMDNDYANRKSVTGSNMPEAITMDISHLSPGLHYFNFRAKTTSGQWGALSRYMVYLSDNGTGSSFVTGYEYWLDKDYDNRTVVEGSKMPQAITMDISNMGLGLHYFSFRAKTASGQWGAMSHYMFFCQRWNSLDVPVKNVEYWIDEDSENRQSQEVENDSVVITMDISQLTFGIHQLKVRCQTADGEWSTPDSYMFTFDDLPAVPTPVVTREGNMVTVSDGEEADMAYPITYYYTTDGTEPTDSSMRYEAPFEVTHNMTIKVVGIQYAHNPSAIARLNVDWFKVAKPAIAQHGNMLTISCDTTRATIYYTIGGGEELVYSAPVRLASASVVTAVGRMDGYHDSETVTYQPRTVKCLTPEVTYNGRKVRLTSKEEGVVIYYTLDGTPAADGLDRSSDAIEYRGEFNVDALCQLKAVAVIDSLNVSDENVYSIDYLYDGETAYVRQGNLLDKAFEWYGGMGGVERLNVEGPLSNADLELLKKAPLLAHLNLGGATLTSNRMPDDAFNGSSLVSFVSPRGFNSAGGQLFANCPQLAAVVWNADATLGANTFDGVDNPNLLLYVNNAAYAPSSAKNIVVNGMTESIVLTDANAGNNNFYCPQAFTVNNISYTRNFEMETRVGVCRGWETITLPFTVQTITHERNGLLQPFTAEGDGKPFWLLQMSPSGLENATEIVANQPYLISMPNTPAYSDEYIQGGEVTFAAQQATIPPTEQNGVSGQGIVLVPALQRVAKSADVYAINRNAAYGEYAEGSVFVANYREVRPFEAYTLHPASGRSLIALNDLLKGSETGISTVPSEDEADGTVKVYTLSGVLVTTGQRSEVMKRLHKGIYIVNGIKTVIK